ncbi:MAG: T9SS type A sorting domain-containing protein [Flavobacteriales bacterium]|nr:T9SS type A sorting domain-containing protein [Flavobacteriales bacterium]
MVLEIDSTFLHLSKGIITIEVTRRYNIPSQIASSTNSIVIYVDDCDGDIIIRQSEQKEEPEADLVEIDNVILYPNPVRDQLQVQFTFDKQSPIAMEITDVYGRSYYKMNVSKAEEQQGWKRIDVSRMPRGVYSLELSLSDGSKTRKKFIVE